MRILKKVLYMTLLIVAIIFIYTNITKATTVEITTETLNLREAASTDSNIVAQISQGQECEVLGEEGDWYQVQYGDYTGYISKEYVRVVDSENDNSTTNVTNSSENNTNNNANDTNADDNSEINSDGTTQTNDVNQSNNETDSQTNNDTNELIAATTNNSSQVRIVPLINGSIIDNLKDNTKVTVINQINGWAYIQTDTISGWVRTETLTIDTSNNNSGDNNSDDNTDAKDNQNDDSTSDFTERTMYTTDFVNIRQEPNTSSNVIMRVEQNTALTVVGESGDWYEVETSQGNAYVSKELLSENQTTVTNRGSVNRTNDTQDKTNEKEEAEVVNTSTSNSSNNTSIASQVVEYAKEFLGVPYVYGGASPSGFDCSGFTMYVFDHFDISMRHGAQAQAKLGKTVNADKSSKSSILNNLQVGDLVFFLDYETMDEIGHCGIYIGDGNFIHASSGSGYCVKINSLLPGEYYNTRFCTARRVL